MKWDEGRFKYANGSIDRSLIGLQCRLPLTEDGCGLRWSAVRPSGLIPEQHAFLFFGIMVPESGQEVPAFSSWRGDPVQALAFFTARTPDMLVEPPEGLLVYRWAGPAVWENRACTAVARLWKGVYHQKDAPMRESRDQAVITLDNETGWPLHVRGRITDSYLEDGPERTWTVSRTLTYDYELNRKGPVR